jgi:uncharacterized protein (DUF433 family)
LGRAQGNLSVSPRGGRAPPLKTARRKRRAVLLFVVHFCQSKQRHEPDELLSRIKIDLNVCSGKPYIHGHRIWVSLMLDFLASGISVEEVLDEYPDLNRDDILACIATGRV